MTTPKPKRVKILSDFQLRKTLSGSKKDAEGQIKKKVVRAALKNPHAYTWPVLETEVEGAILKELVQFATTHYKPPASSDPLYKSKVSETRLKFTQKIREIVATRPKLPKREREAKIDEARKKMDEELARYLKKIQPPSSGDKDTGVEKRVFVVGVNQVLKQAEKGKLAAVFTDAERSVTLVTNALVPMCVAKNLPGVAVKELNNTLAPVLRLKSVTCVGILASVGSDCAVVDLAKKHGRIVP